MVEERKLTKEDIDGVRDIEGFPIAKDEDIIALSRPPYYTACPNPFIADFIREHGTPYNEATDDYHCEPFAADVSEGKNDPIYKAHGYHTKVPYKAIMRYILHYTNPGDIVMDGFCGTGMTGVAAQMCGSNDNSLKFQLLSEMSHVKWGRRKAIISDLSPVAAFIAHNYTYPIGNVNFQEEAESILKQFESEYGWMYRTQHIQDGKLVLSIDGNPMMGTVNYTVWSDVFVCPSCSKEIVFSEVASDDNGYINKKFACPNCGSILSKQDCDRAKETIYDDLIEDTVEISKQVPILVNYSIGRNNYNKPFDAFDQSIIDRVSRAKNLYSFPIVPLPEGYNTDQPRKSHGINYAHQFYTRRNMFALSCVMHLAKKSTISNAMLFVFEQAVLGMAKIARYVPTHYSQVNQYLSGTLYIGSQVVEASPNYILKNKIKAVSGVLSTMSHFEKGEVTVQTASMVDLNAPQNSCDYIFTDPPFGNNLNYSELNFLWEIWLGCLTNNKTEAIMNPVQRKGLVEYQGLMERCFSQYYHILKPGRWITVEFHNSQNAVWNAISEALLRAGFIIADIRVLDKKQGSFKQIVSSAAVKQDLVISAYKPKESFIREFEQHAGEPEMAWEFVRQHLNNVPIAPDSTGLIEVVSERQDYLLFNRMVAFHIMNGIPVPMDAHTFYAGLRERFIQRDGMFFLTDQVNEYDERRQKMELQDQQLSLYVFDEKSAIMWLNIQLSQARQSYSDIQPKYLQELHQAKFEQMPELLDMLKENFLQDNDGKWYVPNLSDKADLEKLRRKRLLKDFFDIYANGAGRIKNARTEAIRVGFDECWKERNYSLIVKVGDRLPENVLQEDPALLMYYDNAANRM